MKKHFLNVVLSIILVLSICFIGSEQKLQPDTDTYFAKYRQHKFKNDGKMPKAERRPNEWFYA